MDYRPRFAAREAMESLHASHGQTEHQLMRSMGYGGLAAGAIAMAPIVTRAVAPNGFAGVIASGAINFCGSALPTGWAASIAELVGSVPLVGATLAAGGFVTIGAAAGLAVGGMLLGNYLDKRAMSEGFPWGKVVRWGCLITSALIAAPMVLSGLTMGLMFLGQYFGIDGLAGFATSTFGTLGRAGELTGAAMAQGSAAMMGVHALTCALPLGASAFLLGKKETPEQPKQLPQLHLPPLRQYDGRVTPPPLLQLAAN
jgi:hypothetical protein